MVHIQSFFYGCNFSSLLLKFFFSLVIYNSYSDTHTSTFDSMLQHNNNTNINYQVINLQTPFMNNAVLAKIEYFEV